MKPSVISLRQKCACLFASGGIAFVLCHYISLMAQRGQITAGPLPWTSRLTLGRVLNKGLIAGFAPNASPVGWFLLWGGLLAIAALAFCFFWIHARERGDFVLLGLIFGAGIATVVDRLRFGGVNDYFLLHVSNTQPAIAFNLPDIILPLAALMLSFRIAFLGGQHRDGT